MLILGQDPYHGPGQAHGLSFSVRDGVRIPPSLRNVFKELAEDVGVAPPAAAIYRLGAAGRAAAQRGADRARGRGASHAGKGWEAFTDATIRALNARDERVVFLLWGGYARKKAALVTNPAHVVLEAGIRARSTRRDSAAPARSARPTRPWPTPAAPPIDWDPRGRADLAG